MCKKHTLTCKNAPLKVRLKFSEEYRESTHSESNLGETDGVRFYMKEDTNSL